MLNRLKYLFIACLMISLVACNSDSDEALVTEIENFVDGSVEEMGKRGNFGRKGCFELVFPLDIVFEDGSVATVDDHEELKATIKTWKEENPEAEKKPTFTFPIDVMTKKGEIITVEDGLALKKLSKECKNRRGPDGRRDGRKSCFKLVFPVSIAFPDATEVSYETRKELKTGLRTWKKANRDSDERPTLVFPITVVDGDGNETEVASSEDLAAMKEACQEG